MKNILITGGCGFIGTELVDGLLSMNDCRIWVVDNLHPQIHGEDPVEPNFDGSVVFEKGDIRDKRLMAELVSEANPDIIYHLAAETGTGQSMDEVARYCDVNVQGTAVLLDAVNRHGSNLKRIVTPSSRAIYGEGAYLTTDGSMVVPGRRDDARMTNREFDQIDEDGASLSPVPTPEEICPNPISIYASTKLMQEYVIEQSGNGKDWDAVFLRLQNVYGPGQSLSNPYTGVLSIFASQLLKGQELNIYEDGGIVRDFVYISDVVNALIKAAARFIPHGTKLNIGSGVPAKMVDVAEILIAIMCKTTGSYRISGDYREGDIRHAIADIRRAKEILDWHPKVDLREGLSELAKWSISSLETEVADHG